MDRRACGRAIAALGAALAITGNAAACVADAFTLDRLAAESAHAVTATIAEVRSYWTTDHTSIETEVTLSGVTRITADGLAPAPDFRFTIIGGTVGDTTLRVCCIPEMLPGDRWMMFLQSEYRQTPVLGMERGMFRIQSIAGVDRLATPDGGPVVAVELDGRISAGPAPVVGPAAPTNASQPRSVRGGIAAVRHVERTEAALGQPAPPEAVTLEAFMAEVRRRLPADRAAHSGPIAPTRITPAMIPVRPKSVEEAATPAEAAP